MRNEQKIASHIMQFTSPPFVTEKKLPTLIIPDHRERTDHASQLEEEIQQLGISESSSFDHAGRKFLIGSAVAASPHTLITTTKKVFLDAFHKVSGVPDQDRSETETLFNDQVPLHFCVWWLRQNGDGVIEPYDFARLPDIQNDVLKETFSAVEKQVALAIKVLSNIAGKNNPSYLHNKKRYTVLPIYGVFGYSPEVKRQASGLSRGPQSNENCHLHVAALAEPELKGYAQDKESSAHDVLKHLSPFDLLFYELTKDAACRFVNEKYKNILSITTEENRSKQPDPKSPIKYLSGYHLRFNESVSFAAALEVLTQVVADFNKIYDAAKAMYQNHHLGQDDYVFKPLLKKYSFTENEITRLTAAILQLPPTLRQISNWLEDETALGQGTARDILQGKLGKYQRRKQSLSEAHDKLLKQIQKLYSMNSFQAAAMLEITKERYNDSSDSMLPRFTLPENLSGGYSFKYKIDEHGKLSVDGITLVFRFSEKNIYEDLVGYRLIRGNNTQ